MKGKGIIVLALLVGLIVWVAGCEDFATPEVEILGAWPAVAVVDQFTDTIVIDSIQVRVLNSMDVRLSEVYFDFYPSYAHNTDSDPLFSSSPIPMDIKIYGTDSLLTIYGIPISVKDMVDYMYNHDVNGYVEITFRAEDLYNYENFVWVSTIVGLQKLK